MSDDQPALLSATVERIVEFEPRAIATPTGLTGELARLVTWWRERSSIESIAWTEVVVDDAAVSAAQALVAGIELADRAIDTGSALLVPRVAQRDDLAARTIIAVLSRREASAVLGQPEGMTDREWMDRCARIRDRMADITEQRGDLLGLLDALGATSIAAVAGALLGAAARRTPCLVDGTDELAAALIADRLSYRARSWWRAGADSPDPGRRAAVERMELEPGLPLGLIDDDAHGARATVALLERFSS